MPKRPADNPPTGAASRKRSARDAHAVQSSPGRRSGRHTAKDAPVYEDEAHSESESERKVQDTVAPRKTKQVTTTKKDVVEKEQKGSKAAKKGSAPDQAPKVSAAAAVKAKAAAAAAKKADGALQADAEHAEQPPKKRRKTQAEKEAEAMPLAARTAGCKMFIGAHVSAAGGVHNAVTNAVRIGGNAFALFLKSQRKWDNPPLKPDAISSFHSSCAEHAYAPRSHILPHGSYLVNLAQADPDKATLAYSSFVEDLQRCETLGIRLYNFHPGNTNGQPRGEAIARLADRLNSAHRETNSVVTVLENMAAPASGNTIGGCFEDLRDVIALVHDKARVGVCLDTCHLFAAGYDLRSPQAFQATLAQFDTVVGAHYLNAVHLNDSKAPLGAHRDLHQNIGLGFLGLRAFHNLVNEPRFWGLPLVLETPTEHKDDKGKVVEDHGVWAREIKLLESLIGTDAEGEPFKTLERDLAEKGAVERAKYQDAFEKKTDKEQKAKTKANGSSKTSAKKKKPKNEEETDTTSASDGE